MQTTKYITVKTFVSGLLKGITIHDETINYMAPGTEVKKCAWTTPDGYIVVDCYPVEK